MSGDTLFLQSIHLLPLYTVEKRHTFTRKGLQHCEGGEKENALTVKDCLEFLVITEEISSCMKCIIICTFNLNAAFLQFFVSVNLVLSSLSRQRIYDHGFQHYIGESGKREN